MKLTAEFTVFTGMSCVILIALFASAPQSGVQSSGVGGDSMVSVEAASATIAKMVEAWERPPPPPPQELQAELEQPLTPPKAPEIPQFELAEAPNAAVQVALVKPEEQETVELDDSTPPPPPPPEPEPESVPEPEPSPAPKPRPKPVPQPERAATSDQTSAGRAELRAAGAGGGSQAGTSTGSTSTASAGQRAKLRSIWGAKIRSRVERRQRYPSGARGNGKVTLVLTIDTSGQLVSHRIARSSGIAAFDQAALKAIARAGKFPRAPKGLGQGQMTFNLPLSFSK